MAFRLLVTDRALIAQALSDEISLEEAQSWKEQIGNKKDNYTMIMFDLAKTKQVEGAVLQVFVEISQMLEKSGIRLMVIANELTAKLIKEKGFSQALPCYVGMVPMGGRPEEEVAQIDVNRLLTLCFDAAKDALRVYSKSDADAGPRRTVTMKERPSVDIAGIAGFFCGEMKGNLLLGFQSQTYLKLVSAIMKKDYTEIGPEIIDWPAELLNSILGKTKAELIRLGISTKVAIPTVVVGKDIDVLLSTKANQTVELLPCRCDFGEFYLELMLMDSVHI